MSRYYNANSMKFVPRPEKKGRNLRQIEEQFQRLEEKEKKLKDKFVEEEEPTNNNTSNFLNSSIMSSTTNESLNQSMNVEGIDNTFIMTYEKRAKSTNSHHNPFRSVPTKPKPPKLMVVPNTTTQFRSSLHIQQTAKKRAKPTLSYSSPINTRHYEEYSDVETEDEINVQDRTNIEDNSDSSSDHETEIVEELPTLFKLSSRMDPKLSEVFAFEVRVHQLAEHPNGLFDVKIYDDYKPFERVHVLKDLRINRDCYIIFHEPSFIKFNALTLPWVEKPEYLINHTLVVEVQGTYPSKTKIAKSTIKFSHKQAGVAELLNKSRRIGTPDLNRSLSPSKSNTKILKLDSNLPFTTTPTLPNEEDLQRSLSCIPVPSLSLKIHTPKVPEEDAVQKSKLERSNSIDSQLSPSSQKYRQLQALRENMKINLMLQQKLLS